MVRRILWGAVAVFAAGPGLAGEAVTFARHLALGPDGATLAFSWAGDIWTVPSDGGAARRLTADPAIDSHPVFSPDGRFIAFSSERFGSANVFVMRADGGDVRRLTFADRPAYPSSFSPDGERVYFHTWRDGQFHWEPAVYHVPVEGGQAFRGLPCFGRDARFMSDGPVVFVRGGTPRHWYRRNYRGTGQPDLWIYYPRQDVYTQLTSFEGWDHAPQVANRRAYYISDRDGSRNVYSVGLPERMGGDAPQPKAVTQMTGDDVRDLAVSANGTRLAFTHWDRLYVMDLPNGEPRSITVTAPADSALAPLNQEVLTSGADEAVVSPNGEEVALVVRGEIFVIPVQEGRLTRRVTHSPYRDRQVTWSPDGKALFFVSDRTGVEQIYRATSRRGEALGESLRFTVEQVTDHADPSFSPQVSPDGKHLAFWRLRGDLVIRELASGDERVLLPGWNAPDFEWSPDSMWMAYSVENAEYNSDVWVLRVDGSEPPVNISQHPDHDADPQWSADGMMLAFWSQREGFDSDVYGVFLAPALDEMSEVDLRQYFEDAEKAVGKRKPLKEAAASGVIMLAGGAHSPAAAKDDDDAEAEGEADAGDGAEDGDGDGDDGEEDGEEKKSSDDEVKDDDEPAYAWDLASAYRRIQPITTLSGDQREFALAPSGSRVAFRSSHEGDAKLYVVKSTGKDRKEVRGDDASGLHFTLNGKRLVYRAGGRVHSTKAEGGDHKTHAFRAAMLIDYLAEAKQKFEDGARALGREFYHPTMKGLDWEALTEKYRDLALTTNTGREFNDIFLMLLGELNASHLGIRGGERERTDEQQSIGFLGCTFDSAFAGPGLKVASILPRGPAAREESKLYVGDVILAVNGTDVGPGRSIDQTLLGAAGELTILEVERGPQAPATTQPSDGEPEEVVIRPAAYDEIRDLAYDAWVDANRDYVERQTDGRVGYLHIRRMREDAFYEFERDLYAAAHGKDGLIVDVRRNGGGWTADWVMTVLMVQRHAYTVDRAGERGYPQGRLPFYAWTKPATMMCDQYSFSNAEIVSHAFKTLDRGPLVGMPTYGGVISTGAYMLIDGTLVRMPGRGWYVLPNGEDMEVQGAIPDIIVPITPADEASDARPQLDAAIEATLEQLSTSG